MECIVNLPTYNVTTMYSVYTYICFDCYDSPLFNLINQNARIQQHICHSLSTAVYILSSYEANPFLAFILSVTPPLTLEILGRFSLTILETDCAYSAFCWLNLRGLMTTPVLFRMAGLLRFLEIRFKDQSPKPKVCIHHIGNSVRLFCSSRPQRPIHTHSCFLHQFLEPFKLNLETCSDVDYL